MLDLKQGGLFVVNGVLSLEEKNVLAGSPLTLDKTTGKYKLAKKDDVVAGVSANSYYEQINDVFGGEWLTNSKMVKVVKIDECVTGPDIVMGADGVPTKVYPYDKTKIGSFAIGDKLYADENGLLTNVAPSSPDDDKLVGIVTKAPSATDEIMVYTINKK